LTCKTCGDNLEKTNLKVQSPVNSRIKLVKKQDSIKKNQVNFRKPTKLTMQAMHVIKFNKFLIPYIIFHFIDLYDNKTHKIYTIKKKIGA
jgi:hypothetical protein